MRDLAGRLVGLGGLLAAACADGVAPEALIPVVDGIYNVDTRILSNSCGGRVNVFAGSAIFIFTQHGRVIEFRPPTFDENGNATLLDLGIAGEVESDGDFSVSGTYTIAETTVVGFSMEGRFTDTTVEGTQRQVASFGNGGFCEVTFSFAGDEV